MDSYKTETPELKRAALPARRARTAAQKSADEPLRDAWLAMADWPFRWPHQLTRALNASGLLGGTPLAEAQAPYVGPASDELPEGPSSLDRLVNAAMARFTLSISPASLALAYLDWGIHLAASPGKQEALVEKALRKATRFNVHAVRSLSAPETPPCIEPLPRDHRFKFPAWQQAPFRYIYQWFLLNQQWWHNATTGVQGVSRHHEQVVSFVARQILDMISPSNFIPTNPELLQATLKSGGQNLVQGAVNVIEDWERAVAGRPPVGSEMFRPGAEVAVTPGQVVHRNRLIELIQYSPATAEVQAEPILIVPAWIMKYYILDLSPHNSLVRFLVDRGHTVFMISWHNPNAADRDLGIEDYLRLGVLEAIGAIEAIVPGRQINAVGYCLGGTLLSIAATYLAREHREVLKSLTVLAAQVDFTEPGELSLFIDEGQLSYLDDLMWNQGYLDTKQMAGAFRLLRSNDLIWSRLIHDYVTGKREAMTDLMAWNADATRMPYRMHSEYLRRLFLDNDLVEGRYEVGGRPVALEDIRIPVFAVSTERDHVAPWRSVYKLNLLLDTELTFVLASGGHNVGIVSEPGHDNLHYRVSRRKAGDRYLDPETWQASTQASEGSWWPLWAGWLEAASTGKSPPPALGAADKGFPPLLPAPGAYVHEA